MSLNRGIDIFTSASLPPALFFIGMVALWTGNMFRTYTDGMLSQVKLIHESQLAQIERTERFEQRMISQMAQINDQTGKINMRVAAIEMYNKSLGLPIYSDKDGRVYFDGKEYNGGK